MIKKVRINCLRLAVLATIAAAALGISASVAELKAATDGCADYYCANNPTGCANVGCDYCAPDNRCAKIL